MATVTTKIMTKPGWDAKGNATLLVSERTYTDGSLDYSERDLAFYELGVLDGLDGEVTLGRYEGTSGDCEIVYSEILSTDTRMDYDKARCDAGLI